MLPWLLLLGVLFAAPAFAQQGRIAFEETTHSFGVIEEGQEARHVFTFRNEGSAPLRVTRVRPSCGCTAPDWTREAVAPGETGTVSVVYHSKGRPGPFKRTAKVLTDGDPAEVVLYISGEVQPMKALPLKETVDSGSSTP